MPQVTSYLSAFDSPLGAMTLAAAVGPEYPEGGAMIGVWFDGQRHDRAGLPTDAVVVQPGDPDAPAVLTRARAWLQRYFAGEDPGEPPPLRTVGTEFQQRVWAQLRTIPRGQVTTYGHIAAAIAAQTGRPCAARAVGGAVGRNPVSLLVPCHRVVGVNGALTGYAGGPERKAALLRLEGAAVTLK
ncbi:methylated-DNA--[protein]-cysteine S-methyltransferase [Actinomyces sp. MRS3W]|uniref:methylated-DNA--[protein]-cysteine S-methyltransferase n=1 Tax=Actinomyces sp. MRS3W TaxID=2800796 RepID=UPI0028FD2A19|nr:methylated-DNA--[protein]-cysteine S-methyltransferase [Actinomyces sp. MRS3W]MDU0348001.1 methylated-DNA--[protein]-cysteine S-methyltransferase [Actinomyces sp. MRS3W]